MFATLFWLLLFIGSAVTLAYRQQRLRQATLVMGGVLFSVSLWRFNRRLDI